MKTILIWAISTSLSLSLSGSLYKHEKIYKVTNGKHKGTEVTFVISSLQKWNTKNIWSSVRARNNRMVHSFFVSILEELYPHNIPAQQELILCYREAYDLQPLLSTTKYDSKEYYIVRSCTPRKIDGASIIVPKEWLEEKK